MKYKWAKIQNSGAVILPHYVRPSNDKRVAILEDHMTGYQDVADGNNVRIVQGNAPAAAVGAVGQAQLARVRAFGDQLLPQPSKGVNAPLRPAAKAQVTVPLSFAQSGMPASVKAKALAAAQAARAQGQLPYAYYSGGLEGLGALGALGAIAPRKRGAPPLSSVRGIPAKPQRRGALASTKNLRGLGDLGALFCPDLTTAVANLGIALQQAQNAGVDQNDAKYQSAQQLYQQQTGFFSKDVIDINVPFIYGGCTAAVNEVKAKIADVNSLIQAKTPGASVVDANAIQPGQNAQLTNDGSSPGVPGIPSWVAPVGLGILGLGTLAWLVSSAAKFKRVSRAAGVTP